MFLAAGSAARDHHRPALQEGGLPAPKHRDLKPGQYNGSIYLQSPPKVKAARPAGEWNRMVIRCEGPRVVIHLNGTEIQNVSMDAITTAPDGVRPLAERPRRRLIGLQSHGDPVDFRRIEIRELP